MNSTNAYHFTTHWRVPSTLAEIKEVLGNGPDLVRWWPAVYLEVREVEHGAENGLGRVVNLYTKGWLPYTLRWDFRVDEVRADGFSLEAWGDFVGRGNWTFKQDGPWVDIRYDWTVSAEKPLLKSLSFLLKPIFEFNHLWAMQKGEESLKLELARRHARTPEDRLLIPLPPAPTPNASPALVLLVAAGVATVGALFFLRRRR